MTDRFAKAVEGAIADGKNRGEFDDLPGAGRPLDLGDTSDPDWWIRRTIARENLDMTGAMPPALVLRREAYSYPESLATEHREAEVRRIVEDYNRRVIEDRKRPVVGPPPPVAPILDVDEIVDRWRPLRSAYEAELRRRTELATAARVEAEAERRRWWQRRR